MKTLPILLLALFVLPAAGQGHKGAKFGGRPGVTKENIGENAAMREEQLLDHLDTHKWKKDPEATDVRPTGLTEYHNRTYQRIVVLLRHGALSEGNGKLFKETHTRITEHGRALNSDGELTDAEKAELRAQLDGLNDDINAALKTAEEASERTPLLNQAQHRFQEQIEFGVRSGRLSTGEANRLSRMVEKLERLEEREKAGGLSTRDREKLFEEAAELAREIHKELKD